MVMLTLVAAYALPRAKWLWGVALWMGMVAAAFAGAGSEVCTEPVMSEERALELAHAAMRQELPDFERYLQKKRTYVHVECREARNLWLISAYGPTYALGDSVLYLLIDTSGEIIARPDPQCPAARLRLTADQAIGVVKQFAAGISWDLEQYGEPYARPECAGSDAPRWFVSARSRSNSPDSELFVYVDDRSGTVRIVSQG